MYISGWGGGGGGECRDRRTCTYHSLLVEGVN